MRAGGDFAQHGRETPGQRAKLFKQVFEEKIPFSRPTIPPQSTQPSQWWGPSFRCKQKFIRIARTERFEIYDKNFRTWRWRLAAEQLLFTNRRPHDRSNELFLANRTPMLLVAVWRHACRWAAAELAQRPSGSVLDEI